MKIVSIDTMRRLESEAVVSGIPEYRLMRRAGIGAASLLEKYCISKFRRVVFFCGGGNNAGDALVCAGSLALPHVIVPCRSLESLKGAAAEALKEFAPRLNITSLDEFDFAPGDLIVDALLGIGFTGTEVRSDIAGALKKIAASGKSVVAFDLPSGLNGDSGIAAGECVQAELTITFGLPKQGLFLNDGPRLSGKIAQVPIGVEHLSFPGALPYTFFTAADAEKLLPRPELTVHKNSRGRVVLLCGSSDYPGAAALASRGALHFSGLVRLLSVRSPNMPPLPAALIARLLPPGPEGELPAEALKTNADATAASDVLCAGCGWGNHVSPELLEDVLQFPGKLILDADALNLLARTPELWNHRSDAVLTPHPGEALRLAQSFNVDTNGSRPEFAARMAKRFNCIVVLKGFHTCVALPDGSVSLNGSGGPELAMAGSGDVLAGIIAGLAAKMADLADAVRLGVFLHGAAGDNGHGAVIADELPALAARAAAYQTWW